MADDFLAQFGWITELLARPLPDSFPAQARERAILEEWRAGWGKGDTAALLRELSAKYGDSAAAAVEKFLAWCIARDWKALGEKEAHAGTEIDDFIRMLWKPLGESDGFEFTSTRGGGKVVFCVTKCPIYDLARKTGLHKWLYHLACSGDFSITPAFSPKIGFSRTKTLVLNDAPCDHTYFRKP
jgi:predicted ArsR family transcriptional regulator